MKNSIFSIAALVATLMLASCQKEDYVNVIPADANLVASVDFATIAEQGELAASGLRNTIEAGLGLMVKSGDRERVMAYIDDPALMGIDFRSPAYLFATADMSIGATMKVYSDSKLEDFFNLLAGQNLCSKPAKKDGRMAGRLVDEVEYSFDGSSLVLLFSGGNGQKLLKQLLEQDADHSFVSNVAFTKMSDTDGVVKVYTGNAEAIPQLKDMDYEMVSALSFPKGKASVKANVWGKTAKAQREIDEAYDNMRKLRGEFDDKMPGQFALWASAGVKGEWLLGKLKENKQAKEALFMIERAIDIEQMLRAVDGDVTLTIAPSITSRVFSILDKPDWTVMAEIKNSDFLNDVAYWMQSMRDYGMKMDKIGEWRYRFNIDGEELVWGVDDDRDELFFASSGAFNAMRFGHDNDALDPYEDDIENSYFYAYINLQTPELKSMAGLKDHAYQTLSSLFKCVIIKSQKKGEVELAVEMKDRNANVLKELIGAAMSIR